MDDAKAREQIARARRAIREGDYKRARYILERTKHPLAASLLADLEAEQLVTEKPKRDHSTQERYEHGRIWRLDSTVPPLALKTLLLMYVLWLAVIPSLSLLLSGGVIWIPLTLAVAVPATIFFMGLTYILFKFYWGCVGVAAFFNIVMAIAVIVMMITGVLYIPFVPFMR